MFSLLSLFRTLSSRYVAKRWNRTGLVVVSIGLGVAMLVSTQLLNECLDNAVREATTPGMEKADLCVSANNKVRLDLAPKLNRLSGVKSVEPVIQERVILPEKNNQIAVLIGSAIRKVEQTGENPFGVRPEIYNLAGMFKYGRPNPAAVAIGKELGFLLDPSGKPTQPFKVRAGGQTKELTPVAIVEVTGPAAKFGGFIIAMQAEAASNILGTPGICSRIDLGLAPGADLETVRRAAQAMVGDQAQIVSPEKARRPTDDLVGGVRIGFTLCGVGAMVVGLFLVYNALAVSVAERRHEIGVLRSVGATRWQIAGMFTGEALLLGVIGALLGVPIGWGMAKLTFLLMQQEMQQLFVTANQPMPITRSLFFLAIGAGMLTAVLASVVPALQAASDEPAESVRRVPSGASRYYRFLQAIGAIVMLFGGLGFALFREHLPHRMGGIGGMVLFLVGLLLAVPILVSLVSRIVQPVIRRVFGIESRLAADNLLRAPGRTGVVVGALAAGVALMFQTAGIGRSNEEPILDWLDRVVIADLIVVCGNPMDSSSAALPMDATFGDKLRSIEGVAEAVPVRYGFVEFRDRLIWITALDSLKLFEAHRHHQSKFTQFEMYAAVARPGTALISENFAALYRVKQGETITIQGPNGPVAMEIVGVIQDYSWSRGSILVDHSFFQAAFEDRLVDSYHVFVKENHDRAKTIAGVKEITDANALAIIERQEFDSWVANMIRRVYMLAYLQQIAVGVVAALGVVMALLISVMQRRRELGLLRAVGSTQGQVLHTVVAEATLMGIFGTILGLIAGVPLEWYILRVIIFEDTGFIFPVTVPWLQTLTLSALAIGVATFAGLFPALHAVRLRIAEAIQYE